MSNASERRRQIKAGALLKAEFSSMHTSIIDNTIERSEVRKLDWLDQVSQQSVMYYIAWALLDTSVLSGWKNPRKRGTLFQHGAVYFEIGGIHFEKPPRYPLM